MLFRSIGDVALAKIPTEILVKLRRKESAITTNRSKAIKEDLYKHQIGDPGRGDVYKTEVERPRTRNVDFGE